ncbi:uncharacterized protein LOC111043494 [Nilaparvata lugens]|uniref:uncharacterized protein LOC111043494 n=1 Tax=Nilaparvata lugens TaxID=108931 RepID=UPI00193E69EE|nr:uncharacterized protein LOC111043494 [Nilaparvata lugens]
MKKLSDMEEQSKQLEKDLGGSINFCHNDVESILKKIEVQDSKLNLYLQKIDKQNEEIALLKTQNLKLQKQVCNLEQYSRVNCVEIQGIPTEANEDVKSLVLAVSKALDHPIDEKLIDNCHRLPSKDRDRPPAIIAKFVRRFDKEALLQKRRIKRDFSTRHLGHQQISPIYLNESLCPERRRLLALAKKAKGEGNFKYLWVRNGKVLARRTDGQPVIVIETVQDLNKLVDTSK